MSNERKCLDSNNEVNKVKKVSKVSKVSRVKLNECKTYHNKSKEYNSQWI